MNLGNKIYKYAQDLFLICRSLSGEGVRETLHYIKRLLPDLTIHNVASGTKAFDWEVPNEWNIRNASIKNAQGEKIINFKKHNLHVAGYSEPVHKNVDLAELKQHLYTLPEQPDAIPYITSYYKKRWGFSMTHRQYENLELGDYTVYIDSNLDRGILNYGDLIIKGREEREIFLSTYICHPSMANN